MKTGNIIYVDGKVSKSILRDSSIYTEFLKENNLTRAIVESRATQELSMREKLQHLFTYIGAHKG